MGIPSPITLIRDRLLSFVLEQEGSIEWYQFFFAFVVPLSFYNYFTRGPTHINTYQTFSNAMPQISMPVNTFNAPGPV